MAVGRLTRWPLVVGLMAAAAAGAPVPLGPLVLPVPLAFRNPEAGQWYHAIRAMGWHYDRLCMWMANARMELVEATTLRLAAEARAKQLQCNLDKIEKKKKDEQKKRYNQNRNVKRALDGVTGKYGDEEAGGVRLEPTAEDFTSDCSCSNGKSTQCVARISSKRVMMTARFSWSVASA